MLQRLYPAGFVFEDLAGTTPAAAGTVYVYLNTTTTLATIYSNTTGTTRSNPITLGADGRLPTDVYVTDVVTVRLREYHVTPASGTLVFTKDNMPNLVPDSSDILYEGGTVDRTIESKLGDILHVKDYGAVGDGVTDDTAAIQAACAALAALHRGTLLFDPLTYRIYPTGTLAAGSQNMNLFTAVRGLHINGRGAQLSIQDVFETGETLYIFNFSACSYITVENFTFTQPAPVQATSTTMGQVPIYFTDGCQFITIRNTYQTGGLGGALFVRDTTLADITDKAAFITMQNCNYTRVGYPINCQNSGDWLWARNIRMSECYRGYFIYGVRNHDVEVTIDNGYASPPFLMYAGYGQDADSAFLEDINVKIRSNKRGIGSVTTQPVLGSLQLVWYTARNTPAQVRNIKVNFDVEMVPDNGLGLYSVFLMSKLGNDLAVDATDRGHIVENIELGGTITKCDHSGGHGAIIQLMGTGLGTWSTGEFVRNITFRDLVITGTGGDTHIDVGMGSIIGDLVLENVQAPVALVTSGTPQYGIQYRNCLFGSTMYHDVINSLQTITGSGAVDITHRLTNLNTTGGGTYTLADGYEGLRKTITMTVDSGTDGVVTPSTFVGNPSATITFNDVGDTAELLFTAGAWVFLGGTATVA